MPYVIKRYSNRKLYDTQESRYVTLEELEELIRAGKEISVVDVSTGEDLTCHSRADHSRERAEPSRGPSHRLSPPAHQARGGLAGLRAEIAQVEPRGSHDESARGRSCPSRLGGALGMDARAARGLQG